MKKYFVLNIFLVLLTTWVEKSKMIDFDKALEQAEVVKFGKVISYFNETRLSFVHFESNDTLLFYCEGKTLADDMRQSYTERHLDSQELAGYWPQENESVLILANTSMNIRLMARKEKENYRFWDPYMDLLGSWFYFSKPALPLEICIAPLSDKNDSTHCFDGCRFPVNRIKER